MAQPHVIDLTRLQGAPAATTPAGFRVRFAAWVIDAAALAILASVLGSASALSPDSDSATLLVVVVVVVYIVGFTAALGGTPGKRMFGLTVVDEHGVRVGFLRAAARTLLYVLSVPFGIGLWRVVRGDPERRAFHDSVARTRVVRSPLTNGRRGAAIALVTVLLILAGLSVAFDGSSPAAELQGPTSDVRSWVLYQPPTGGFTAEFPVQPVVSAKTERAAGEVVEMRRYLAAFSDGSTFMVWVVPFTAADRAALGAVPLYQYDDALEAILTANVREMHAADFVFDGIGPQRTAGGDFLVVFSATLDDEVVRGHAVYSDGAIYVFETGGPVQFSDRYSRFLNSYRVT